MGRTPYKGPQKRPHHKGSGTVFENPVLEKLTKTHIAVPLTLYSLISAGFLYYGVAEMGFTATQITLLFITGMISYTLIEYLMHRYIYHIRPYTEAFEKFSYKVHGVHHEYPKDKKRLVMPPVPALVLTAFFSCFRTCDGGVCLRFPARFYHGLYHLSGHTLQCSCL